ncbi:ApeA N-terminal domain 1-containing protein [Pseudomonas mediterranea]|uniref:ApeA N-terminal domain 1-containing protein n=1 Tax=Pseudomonas mediterranea TaxID=183795 RepID=UPI00118729C7|nr:HEPN domain-containing protein [Pseudomonas mediterranea]
MEVYHDDYSILGEGQLTFGGGSFICIQLDLNANFRAPQRKLPTLKAKTKEGRHFTLFNCEIDDRLLYAGFIVCGNVKAEISAFHVKYAELSNWFLHGQNIVGELGKSVSWKNPSPQLSITIKMADEDFSLKTETFSSLTKRGEDHVIHEHTRFIFERAEGVFSVDELREKIFELSTLLSLLTATPVSIANVWVGFGVGHPIPTYFPAFKKIDRDSSNGAYWISCLTQRHSLDDKWQSIFERFYTSHYRKTSWVRLAGMQRYEGFWEFKVLGYVSLLDEYVSTYAEIANQKVTKAENKKVKKFKEQIKLLKTPLDKAQIKDMESLVESIFVTSRELTFREKYDYAKSLTDENICKVINLTDDDFSLIKRIRDKIAHGSAPDLSDTSYQELHVIVEKITLLMTYWAHSDLGFSPSDFAIALKYTHNRLQFNPGLDKIHLDRITNSAEFIKVSENLFNRFASGQVSIVNACFIQSPEGKLAYSERHKDMYNAWINNQAKTSNYVIEAFGSESERVTAVNRLYLECGEKTIRLHMAYIIKDV